VSGWEKDDIVAVPRWEADPVVRLSSAATAGAKKGARPGAPLVVLGEGLVVPALFARPMNPNSAGHYPLGRRYSVGDEAVYAVSGLRKSGRSDVSRHRVTKVDEEQDRVEINGGRTVWDLMGNYTRTRDTQFDTSAQFVPAELYVGRKWTAAYSGTVVSGREGRTIGVERAVRIDFAIVAREPVKVPAGTFEAFRLQGYGAGPRNSLEETIWLVPYLNFPVRWDRGAYHVDARFARRYVRSERWELVSARQYAIDG
jgi:hypothetical protein